MKKKLICGEDKAYYVKCTGLPFWTPPTGHRSKRVPGVCGKVLANVVSKFD